MSVSFIFRRSSLMTSVYGFFLGFLLVGVLGENARSSEVFNYGQFTDATNLQFNGSASVAGSVLELTNDYGQASSAYYVDKVVISEFASEFDFQLSAGANTGDGITFIIQDVGLTALGAGGAAMGFWPISTPNIGIKFDIFDNSGEGSSSTGLYLNGAFPTVPAIDLNGAGIDLHSGHVFRVNIEYNGESQPSNPELKVTITDLSTNAMAAQNYPIDLASLIGSSAYVGFTASTGASTAVQNILSWSFSAAESAILSVELQRLLNILTGSSKADLLVDASALSLEAALIPSPFSTPSLLEASEGLRYYDNAGDAVNYLSDAILSDPPQNEEILEESRLSIVEESGILAKNAVEELSVFSLARTSSLSSQTIKSENKSNPHCNPVNLNNKTDKANRELADGDDAVSEASASAGDSKRDKQRARVLFDHAMDNYENAWLLAQEVENCQAQN